MSLILSFHNNSLPHYKYLHRTWKYVPEETPHDGFLHTTDWIITRRPWYHYILWRLDDLIAFRAAHLPVEYVSTYREERFIEGVWYHVQSRRNQLPSLLSNTLIVWLSWPWYSGHYFTIYSHYIIYLTFSVPYVPSIKLTFIPYSFTVPYRLHSSP